MHAPPCLQSLTIAALTIAHFSALASVTRVNLAWDSAIVLTNFSPTIRDAKP